jgi:hypothetical protein
MFYLTFKAVSGPESISRLQGNNSAMRLTG